MVNVRDLIDHAKVLETVRAMRWPEGTTVPIARVRSVIEDGRDDTQPDRQRYHCHGCRSGSTT